MFFFFQSGAPRFLHPHNNPVENLVKKTVVVFLEKCVVTFFFHQKKSGRNAMRYFCGSVYINVWFEWV